MFGIAFTLKTVGIVALVAFLSGSINGAYWLNKWHNYDKMAAQIDALKAANKRYRDAVGVSKDIDIETSDVEADNETILSAIEAKIADAMKKRGPPNACKSETAPAPKPDDPEPRVECIPADVLRAIGDLK